MGSAEPSQSGVDKHKGTAAGGRPGLASSRGGGVRASEGTNPLHPSVLRDQERV